MNFRRNINNQPRRPEQEISLNEALGYIGQQDY